MKLESIKTNGNECLSGSFITSTNDTNEIKFSRGEEKITLRFTFKEKEEKKVITTDNGITSDLIVSFELPLLNDTNQGFITPMLFATYDNGDQVYLNLWITKTSKPYVEVHYSVYEVKING